MPPLMEPVLKRIVLLTWISFVSSGPSSWSTSSSSSSSSSPSSPSFLATETEITVQEGQQAFFHCQVNQLKNETVSWIRSADSNILYIGDVRFVDDSRFELMRGVGRPAQGSGGATSLSASATTSSGWNLANAPPTDWTLRLSFVQEQDSGHFECQISTSPKLSRIFRLNVVVPSVQISGDAEMFVEAGSSVVLRCSVSQWLVKPQAVFWYRNGASVGSDLRVATHEHMGEGGDDDFDLVGRDHVVGHHVGHPRIVSLLSIDRAMAPAHSGKYECAPANVVRRAGINLHVIKDENAAAMQREVNAGPATRGGLSTPIFVLMGVVMWATHNVVL